MLLDVVCVVDVVDVIEVIDVTDMVVVGRLVVVDCKLEKQEQAVAMAVGFSVQTEVKDTLLRIS